MIDYERWDVVTALFPFTDVPVRKPRPMLVLSHAVFNRRHGHVIGAMITTGAGSRWPSDHPIADLRATGLSHSSLVRWKIFTLPAEFLGRKIGALGHADLSGVAGLQSSILG